MWTEAAALRISAAAVVSDPTFADFQQNNPEPGGAATNASPLGVSSVFCNPAHVPATGSSNCGSPSFSSAVPPSSPQKKVIRQTRRISNAKHLRMQVDPKSQDIGQHYVVSPCTRVSETGQPAHSSPSHETKLDAAADNTSRAEGLKELLFQNNYAVSDVEQRARSRGSGRFSFPQASGADSEGSVMILPSPECVLKTKLDSGEKVFINLCSHEAIERWHHKDILLENEGHETSNEGLRIPLSVGESETCTISCGAPYKRGMRVSLNASNAGTECNDKAGAPALAVDVVFNKGTLGDCLKQLQLKQLLAQFAVAAVSHKYNLSLQESFSFPRLAYKSRGRNPRPQRIRAVKAPEIRQVTSLSSTTAARDTTNKPASFPLSATEAATRWGQFLFMPPFECWFVRPSALHDLLSFWRGKLQQKLTASSTLQEDDCAADLGIKSPRSMEKSAGISKIGLVELPDISNTTSNKRQNEASAPAWVPFLSAWLAAECAEEADISENTGILEKKGMINAFDFDSIAHGESKVDREIDAHNTPTPTAVKERELSHQEVKEVEQPALTMKRAFLLSPEERCRQKEVVINKSVLQGTTFVFQLNVCEPTQRRFSDATLSVHGKGSPRTQWFSQATPLNGSAAVSPALLTPENPPRTISVVPLRDGFEPSTPVAVAADLQAKSTSFTACLATNLDQAGGAERVVTTTGAASSLARTSGCWMKHKSAANWYTITSFLNVEISDTQLLVTWPNDKAVPGAERTTRGPCSANYCSFTFPFSSSLSARSADGAHSPSTTGPQKNFLYVFPFAFRSNFAHAYLFPEGVLTVLVPTDLTAAAALEDELMKSVHPLFFGKGGELGPHGQDNTQFSTCLAVPCQRSSMSTGDGLAHSTRPQADIGAGAMSKKSTISPGAHQRAALQLNAQCSSKGFANQTLDAIF